MTSFLLAFDPSLTATGYAVFDLDRYESSKPKLSLVDWGVSRTDERMPRQLRIRKHLGNFTSLRGKYGKAKKHDLIVICEDQFFCPTTKNPNAIGQIQKIAGIIEGCFNQYEVIFVKPQTWQGAMLSRVPGKNAKAKIKRRVEIVLNRDLPQDAADAALIGLWWIGENEMNIRVKEATA